MNIGPPGLSGGQPWGSGTIPRVFDSYHGYAAPNPSSYGDCPAIQLPPGGHIKINNNWVTLTDHAIYKPNCTYIAHHIDRFYASTTVFIYVVGTTTAIAWMLFILLLINQRHSRSSNTLKTTGWLQAHGVSSAIAGRTPLGGLGNRPWLQKAAVFLVTLGLTVASVDTFKNAKLQHHSGWNSARWMRDAVVRSYEIRILRVVSGVFIWLALIQTLIRLFPRRKEKLIIKWFGFGLILLDTVFSCLNMFLVNSDSLPGDSQDPISVLAYLFQLSINLLYAAWVSYYVVTQRRFAFFRPDELNMSIVALLALVSITIPVAFFIADIAVPPVAAWGDFFRWVGGTAASVVVWEWVERIEALEREEKRDGILGREVFDEDELSRSGNSPDRSPSIGSSSGRASGSGGSSSSSDGIMAAKEKAKEKWILSSFARRFGRNIQDPPSELAATNNRPSTNVEKQQEEAIESNGRRGSQAPASTAPSFRHSLPSINQRASPGSTIYAVHYHPVQATPPPLHNSNAQSAAHNTGQPTHAPSQDPGDSDAAPKDRSQQNKPTETPSTQPRPAKIGPKYKASWAMAAFKRRKRSPPLEIKKAMQRSGSSAGQLRTTPQRLTFRRLHALGTSRRGSASANDTGSGPPSPHPHQPTIIPAPPRGQTWSPDILRHSPVHLLHNAGHALAGVSHAHPGLAYRKTPVENPDALTSAEASANVQQDPNAPAQDPSAPAYYHTAPRSPTHDYTPANYTPADPA